MLNWLLPLLGVGLYQTDWGKDWIQKMMGVPQANSAYDKALGMNQQQYDEYIDLLKEQATETQPYQQGLLWQLMTGGNQDETSKFQWGDAWNAINGQPNQTAITDQTGGGSSGGGSSYAKTRDNIIDELEFWEQPGKDIQNWVEKVIPGKGGAQALSDIGDIGTMMYHAPGNILEGLGQVPSGLAEGLGNMGTDLYQGAGDLAGKLKGSEIHIADFLGDTGTMLFKTPGKFFDQLAHSNLGGGVADFFESMGSAAAKAGKKFGHNIKKIFLGKRAGTGNENDELYGSLTTDDFELTPRAQSWLQNLPTNLNDGIAKMSIEGDKLEVTFGNGYTRTMRLEDAITYSATGQEKVDRYSTSNQPEQQILSPLEKAIKDIEINEWEVEGIDFHNRDKSKIAIKHSQGTKIIDAEEAFPDTDLSKYESLELGEDGTMYGVTPGDAPNETIQSAQEVVDAELLDNGKMKVTFADGTTETRTVADSEGLDSVYVHNGQILGKYEETTQGETTRGITINGKNYNTAGNGLISEASFDSKTGEVVFKDDKGETVRVPVSEINADVPLDDITDVSLDDGKLNIATETENYVESVEDTSITAGDAVTGSELDVEALAQGMTPEEALNKFMMGSQLGSLFGKQWQQESQGMMGNAARLEKESLNQILGLGANRNPYGWSGATEGMARDLERGAIIPAKLDAFNYPTQQSDQMIMGTLGNLMQPNNINYPMPASVQPNYYGAMAGNQLGTLGLLGIYSNPFSLLTNHMSNRNTNKSSGPNTMSGFGQSLGLSTLFGQ